MPSRAIKGKVIILVVNCACTDYGKISRIVCEESCIYLTSICINPSGEIPNCEVIT